MKIQNLSNTYNVAAPKKVLTKQAPQNNLNSTNLVKPSKLSFGNSYYDDNNDKQSQVFSDIFANCANTFDVYNTLLNYGTYTLLPFASKIPAHEKPNWTISLDEVNAIYLKCSNYINQASSVKIEEIIRSCEKESKELKSRIYTTKNLKELLKQIDSLYLMTSALRNKMAEKQIAMLNTIIENCSFATFGDENVMIADVCETACKTYKEFLTNTPPDVIKQVDSNGYGQFILPSDEGDAIISCEKVSPRVIRWKFTREGSDNIFSYTEDHNTRTIAYQFENGESVQEVSFRTVRPDCDEIQYSIKNLNDNGSYNAVVNYEKGHAKTVSTVSSGLGCVVKQEILFQDDEHKLAEIQTLQEGEFVIKNKYYPDGKRIMERRCFDYTQGSGYCEKFDVCLNTISKKTFDNPEEMGF